MPVSLIFAQATLKNTSIQEKKIHTLKDMIYAPDWNSGDVGLILQFADDLLNDIGQLIFLFLCFPIYCFSIVSIQNLDIPTLYVAELARVPFHTMQNTMDADLSEEHLCTNAINCVTT